MFQTKISANINQGSFATEEDVKREGHKIDYKNKTAVKGGVIMSSDGEIAYASDDEEFFGVVGATSSKKTRCVVMPFIYNNALAGNSMIINDVKGDIYEVMSATLEELGYNIKVLNFNDPEKGDAYNLLTSIYRDYKSEKKDKANRELSELAETIFESVKSEKDPFWHIASSNYFCGNMLTIFDLFDETKANIANGINLHIQGNKYKERGYSYFKSYFSDKEDSDAWKMLFSAIDAPNETRSSIYAVYGTALNRIIGQNQALIDMMSYSTFDMEDVVKEKTAVFIIANEVSLSVHSGLITALIQQWYHQLVHLAEQTGGRLLRKVVYVLDEFGNLPAIKDFQMKISLSRARGISWMIVLQSLAQLEYRYGKDVSETIVGNTANWVYLFSPDPELLKYISTLCGETVDEYTGEKRELLSLAQLRRFRKNNEQGLTECLMLLGRMNPFVTYLPDISRYVGIKPCEKVEFLKRDKKVDIKIDFQGIVEEECRRKIEEESEERERKQRQIFEEMARKREAYKANAPQELLGILNGVISGLQGGNV